jgi:fibronectin-binding protein
MHGKFLEVASVATIVAAISASAASAGTITYTSENVIGDEPLSIAVPTNTGEVWAGMFQLTVGSQTINAWCVDLYHDLQPSGTYNVGLLTTTTLSGIEPVTLSSNQIGEIGALVVNGYHLVSETPPTGYSQQDVAAAIQIAIWEAEYPTFAATGLDAEQSLANTYLTDAQTGSGAWAPFYGITALTATNDQGLATNQTLVTVTGVPEASTWAMMVMGFAGLGYAAFHRTGKREPVTA